MGKELLKKCFSALSTILLVSLLVFFIFQFIPGDPVLGKLGETPDPALEAALREEFHLDKDPFSRYLLWLTSALKGDFGNSIRYNRPVGLLIGASIVPTITLAVMSLLLVLLIGIPLGIYIGKHRDKKRGYIANLLTQVVISIPTFFMAILLIILFSVLLKWVPVMAYRPVEQGVLPFIKGLLLPALAIALASGGTIARYTRASVVEQATKEYVKVARNKGLKENYIFYKHILKNALVPVVTMVGITAASVVGGTVVIEKAFNIPGVGKLLFEAIKARDLPLAQGIIVYLTLMVVLVFFVLDILYPLIDPRMRKGDKG